MTQPLLSKPEHSGATRPPRARPPLTHPTPARVRPPSPPPPRRSWPPLPQARGPGRPLRARRRDALSRPSPHGSAGCARHSGCGSDARPVRRAAGAGALRCRGSGLPAGAVEMPQGSECTERPPPCSALLPGGVTGNFRFCE